MKTENGNRKRQKMKGHNCAKCVPGVFLVGVLLMMSAANLAAQTDIAAAARGNAQADSLVTVAFVSEVDSVHVCVNGVDTVRMPSRSMSVALKKGMHSFFFRKNGYNDLTMPMTITDSCTIPFRLVALNESAGDRAPLIALVRIISEPKGASIILNGLPAGITPKEFSIEAGEHMLVLQKECFYDDSIRFTALGGRKTDISRVLNPHFGAVEIISLPEPDADVYIDSVKIGTTPFLQRQFPSGNYVVRLSRPMSDDTIFAMIVQDLKITRHVVPMSVNYGELIVDAPWGAIYINDSLVSTEHYYSRLNPGTYRLRAERGWQSTPVNVPVVLGSQDIKKIQLDPLPRLGMLSVIISPFEASDADIYVNDERKGRAPFVIPMIIGDYNIRAQCSGFSEQNIKFVIKEKEKTNIQIKLEPLTEARQVAISSWSMRKWIGVGAAAAATAVGIYFYTKYSSNYRDYKSTIDSDNAAKFKDATQKNQKYFQISISLGSVAAAGSIFSCFMQMRQ